MRYSHLAAWRKTSDATEPTTDSTLTTSDEGGLSAPILIEERVDRIPTRYRESPYFIGVLRATLGQVADTLTAASVLPEAFQIESAIGDQLTLLGKRLGWPRCHCVCTVQPVFGFVCGPQTPNKPIVGFCEGGSWANCQEAGTSDYCFSDDETYRKYLLARRYQSLQLWDIESLQAASYHLWGSTATVVNMEQGRVAVIPGRPLTLTEQIELPLAFRVLPIAPGIQPYTSTSSGRTFGFGAGWGGFCENAEWFCPQIIDPYSCA